LDTLVGLLAVLKAGAAYLPLDPEYPSARLRTMLSTAEVKQVLLPSGSGDLEFLQGVSCETIDISLHCRGVDEALAYETAPPCPATKNDLAYVIFTSGSTGEPNGVLIEHRAVVNTITDINERFGVTSQDRVLALSSFGFDLSVYDFFGLLAAGGSLVLPTPHEARHPKEWNELVRQHKITLWNSVPALMEMLTTYWELGVEPVPPTLRLAMLSGDWIPVTLPDRIRKVSPAMQVESLGGATEASIWSIGYSVEIVDPSWASIPYGTALNNQSMWVLNELQLPKVVGEPGEIYIGGVGVARGYLKRPELNAQRFVELVLPGQAKSKYFRTRDQGRLLPDGNIEFLGRLDTQVKVNGYRIELGEIEAVMLRHDDVRQAAVVAPRDENGRRSLTGHVAWQEGATATCDAVQVYLKEGLPAYMAPARIVEHEQLPLTSNGKIDRRRLEEMSVAAEHDDIELAVTELEEQVVALWRKVLGRQHVDMEEPFIVIGGDSLQAVQLMLSVNARFGLDLPLTLVLDEGQTPRAMAIAIGKAQSATGSLRLLTPVPNSPDRMYPASGQQQQLWIHEQVDRHSAAYHIPLLYAIRGELDVARLRTALEALSEAHEALRTTFHRDRGGILWQRVEPHINLTWKELHLEDGAPEAQQSAWGGEERAFILRRFDLATDTPIRALVARFGMDDYRLLIVVHHIAFDGWSLDVFQDELSQYYDAASGQGGAVALPSVQYRDYAVAQGDWLKSAAAERSRLFWRESLRGPLPLLELPTDYPRPVRPTRRGGVARFSLSADQVARLREFGKQENATLFAVLIAAWQVLLARRSGQDEILVGIPLAARNDQELQRLIGYFVNVVALRAKLGPQTSFRNLIKSNRDSIQNALHHQSLPWTEIVSDLEFNRQSGDSAPFRTMFAYQAMSHTPPRLGDAEVRGLHVSNHSAKFDLLLSAVDCGEGIDVELEYSHDLFLESTILTLVAELTTIVQSLPHSSDVPVWRSAILPEGENTRLMELSGETSDYPRDLSVVDVFRARCQERPDAIAVVNDCRSWTYRDLDLVSDRIGRALLAAGVRAGEAVGVCTKRSIELLAGLLGVLKVGGAYVPLDPHDPASRLQELAQTAQVRTVVSGSESAAAFRDLDLSVVSTKSPLPPEESAPAESLQSRATADGAAYVLFTSGSTGKPKGVVCPHRAIVRLVVNNHFLPLGPRTRCLHLAPVAFDASTLEIWGPLLNGGTVVMSPVGLLAFDELEQIIAREQVNTLWLTAGLFHQVVDHRISALRPLDYLLSGGDVLSPSHVRKVLQELPRLTLVNGYGPTENTTFTTCHVMPPGYELPEGSVPIGKPIANTQVFLLDGLGQLAPLGALGEIHCAGDGLAIGYLGDNGLNQSKFITWTAPNGAVYRLYKTGDLGRWRADGTLEFAGRVDRQIKVRGFRIEPAEIETALCQDARVQQAVATALEEANGHKQLIAYLVVKDGVPIPENELRDRLRQTLPPQMMPTHFLCLDELPLDANGKVHHASLPKPVRESGRAEVLLPRDEIESKLADIWKKLLGVEQPGVLDDFFVAGGDSLVAVTFLSYIERQFGVSLSVTELVGRPTIEMLAEVLRDESPALPFSGAVEVRGGAGPVLFAIPCINANMLTFRALANWLTPGPRVVGLQPRGLDGRCELDTTLEAMIEHYVEDIRSVQPHGPYYLAGYSLGGTLAPQIGNRLKQLGEDVAWVAIIDAPTRARPWALRVGKDVRNAIRDRLFGAPTKRGVETIQDPDFRQRVISTHFQALIQYQVTPYSGPAVVFRANNERTPVKRMIDGYLYDWVRHGLLDVQTPVYWVSGQHDTIFAEPNVEQVGKIFDQELTAAIERSTQRTREMHI
jgi:amino acid adenylation domain-containing protein